MKKFLLTAVLILMAYNFSFSQNISGNTDWKSEDDFRAAEIQVVENIKWLQDNPNINNDEQKKNVEAYALKWLEGCPYITVDVEPDFLTDLQDADYKYSPNMTTAYMFGKALYYLMDKENDKTNEEACVFGIAGMVRAYNAIVAAVGDEAVIDTMENYKKMYDENSLYRFVKRTLKK